MFQVLGILNLLSQQQMASTTLKGSSILPMKTFFDQTIMPQKVLNFLFLIRTLNSFQDLKK